MAADLESLLNTLSNNTHFVKIDPLGPEIQGFKGRPATPIFEKSHNLVGRISQTPHPIDLKFGIWCCEITLNKYTKFHQNQKW